MLKRVPKYPDWWWPMFARKATLLHYEGGGGFKCEICGKDFLVGLDARGRANLGWLRSAAENHAVWCGEIQEVAHRMGVSRGDAERLRRRWMRQINAERRTSRAAERERQRFSDACRVYWRWNMGLRNDLPRMVP